MYGDPKWVMGGRMYTSLLYLVHKCTTKGYYLSLGGNLVIFLLKKSQLYNWH